MSYAEDTPPKLYDEFVIIENEIEKVGRNIKPLAIAEANAISAYEKAKCDEVILMLGEEANPDYDGPKRTDKTREALYRSRHSGLRLAMYLAKAEFAAEKQLLSALESKLTGMQSRKGLMVGEMKLGGQSNYA
jgi:hypothetical protein